MVTDNVSLDLLQKQLAAAKEENARLLQRGGGGGTYGGMDARVKALEDRADRMDGKLDTLIKDVAEIKGKISNMPGYPGLFVICAALVGVVALVVRFLPPVLPPA